MQQNQIKSAQKKAQKKAFLVISHKSAQNHTKSPHPAPHKVCRFYQAARTPPRIDHYPTLAWFNEGDTRAYKIRFPNGTVDVFRGWVSSIGKAVTAKEVITRTVKVTNVGRPSMAEDRSTVTAATGMTVTPASTSVVKGQSTTLTVAFQPEGATDKSFRAVSADKTKATVSVSGMTITVKGVAAGKVNIPVVSGNGELAVVAEITVTDS